MAWAGESVLKVAIGYHVQDGPWGGGNLFVKSIADALVKRGDEVVFHLDDPDVDIIVMMDPRSRLDNFSFGAGRILRYQAFTNPNALSVHRINECDERKKTKTMNWKLRLANYCADHTVFIASWLKDLTVWRAAENRSHSVILNGGDRDVFHSNGQSRWDGNGPLKFVTHHWGGNWMKGFDIYSRLDDLLDDPEWRERISLTYIGNVPKGFVFRNVDHRAPQSGEELAASLREHHAYLTASQGEPGGMHHIEGGLCGLPLLYRDSGALPEYAAGHGVIFNEKNFDQALQDFIDHYPTWADSMTSYPHDAEKMVQGYLALFDDMIQRRTEILQNRRLWRSPLTFMMNQIPW